MKNKKTKFIAGICLIIQAVAFFLLFLIYMNKKRSLANAFAAVAAVGGVAGAALLFSAKEEAKKHSEAIEDSPEEDDFEAAFDEDDIFCAFEDGEPQPAAE